MTFFLIERLEQLCHPSLQNIPTSLGQYMEKTAEILKLVDEIDVPSFKPWESHLYINLTF